MRSRWGDDRGSATAELAVALPAVALVLAMCLAAVHVVGGQVRLTDAAADAARALGRGEEQGTAQAIAERVAGRPVSLGSYSDGDLVCVALASEVGGVLGGFTVRADSCAMGGGR